MKNKLEIAREIISSVDKEMLNLFIKRMEAAKMVALYKYENNLPILDEIRENDIINKQIDLLDNKEIEKYFLIYFEGLLTASKEYQKDLLSRNE